MNRHIKSKGSEFHNGKLYLFGKNGGITVIQPWNHTTCWKSAPGRDSFFTGIPVTFDWMFDRHISGQMGATPGARRELENFARFMSKIPDRAVEILKRFSTHRWEILKLASHCGKPAMELLENNPVLGMALSCSRYFTGNDHPDMYREIRAVLKKKQRDILKWLGFPGTGTMVRIMRIIPPHELESVELLIRMQKRLHQPLLLKRLRHLPRLNAGILWFGADSRIAGRISDHFLRDVLDRSYDECDGYIRYWRLLETIGMLDTLNDRTIINSLDDMKRVRDNIIERYQLEQYAKRPYPSPPIPGLHASWISISPLSDAKELRREAMEQNNCCFDCIRRIIEHGGWFYLYRLDAPERATASIDYAKGEFFLVEIKGKDNRDVSDNARRAVERWLAESQLAAPETVLELKGGTL